MRQVLAHSQELRRRQLDWLTALEERAYDVRCQIGQSNKRSEIMRLARDVGLAGFGIE